MYLAYITMLLFLLFEETMLNYLPHIVVLSYYNNIKLKLIVIIRIVALMIINILQKLLVGTINS